MATKKEMIEEVQETTIEETKTEETQETTPVEVPKRDPLAPYAKNDRVRVKLMKDSGKYKDDKTICVNGHAITIQRGVWVEIPRAHYEALMNSMRQDQAVAELITANEQTYQNAVDSKMM